MFGKLFKRAATKPVAAASNGERPAHRLPIEFLRKLIPIGEQDSKELIKLPIALCQFNAGDIVFNRGEASDTLIYLYSGKVFLESANGGYTVEENTFKACYPLAAHGEHSVSAIAQTPSQLIYLPLSLLRQSSAQPHNPLANRANPPAELRNSPLFAKLCAAYDADALQVPSLPDVALRLRSALQKDISVADAVKIVNLDPAISSKLVQVANSPIYRGLKPVSNSHDAVNHLGFKITQNLVTSVSLHQLFRSTNKVLQQKSQQAWKQSIQIASLSCTLAGLGKKINADEALLAGLTHNIGVLPIITLAGSLPASEYTEAELDACIDYLQGLFGTFILKKWHFPDTLIQIPAQTGNWYYDAGEGLQLHDIVLLAKFHSQLGGIRMHKLPPLNTLPAFHKLDDCALTPDMSLQVLQDAKQQIAEALAFFRA
ncbi:cyclic nucleotide-binding protein [Methylomonas sp. LWB]|uniref:HDOD domain-containing protein n=1 Tax=Methylomonas sp. LWB TaxID=1905845 RepID=UPI0008DB0BFE|nr:HDOD domain-containing protein [Methylomonas sp. LWB]OHX37378.1 cyclic nucleotide-binding protein [Methylomonas sp. LWB]